MCDKNYWGAIFPRQTAPVLQIQPTALAEEMDLVEM